MHERAHDGPELQAAPEVAAPPAVVRSLAVGHVLALQRSAGNAAVSRLLGAGSRGSVIAREQMARPNEMVELMAGAISNPIHGKLTRWYGYNGGAPCHLSADELRQCNLKLNIFGFKAVHTARNELIEEFKRKEEQGDSLPVEREVKAKGRAVANGSMGQCEAHVDGKLSYSPAMGAWFDGTVRVTDTWNFDPNPVGTYEGKSGRSWMGELQTIVGWAVLPGDPFDITSESLKVSQNQLQDTAGVF